MEQSWENALDSVYEKFMSMDTVGPNAKFEVSVAVGDIPRSEVINDLLEDMSTIQKIASTNKTVTLMRFLLGNRSLSKTLSEKEEAILDFFDAISKCENLLDS